MSLQPSEQVAVVGAIDPAVLASATGTFTSDWVAVKDWHELMAVVMVGTLGASSTVDAKLQQATDGTGTGAKDIAGKAITQLTDADSDDNKQAVINLKSNELDVDGGFTHVALVVTVGTADSPGAALLLGLHPRYGPASDHDLASVNEIVT